MSLCELAKCRRVVTAVLAVAACAGLAGAAHAHPHVWATVRSEIILNADHQITGVRHSWTFDEFYSAMAVQGLDTNGDGVFSAKELEPLAEVNIKSLKDFDYFTFVHIGDADNLPLKPPETIRSTTTRLCSRCTSRFPSRSRSIRTARRFRLTSTIRPSSSPSASPPKRR